MTYPRPPAQVAPFVEVLGASAAMTSLMTFGGAELYLARAPQSRSGVAQREGLDRARALAEMAEARGLPARIPTAKPWLARCLFSEGLAKAEIARKLHVSDVTVRKWLAGAEDPDGREDPRQMRLL